MEIDDWQLLTEYAAGNSEQAFRSLVDRYAGIAYHAALSSTGHPGQAQEVTQAVFIALARKAGRIPRGTVLSGWIFQAARFAALNLARAEARRKHYEQEAFMSDSMTGPDETESVWAQIAPHLYEAMDKLSKTERDALLIRFFQNKSHREVAQALGVSEDAAKARVSRAIERLRMIFAKAGMVTPSAALTAALSTHAAPVAPVGLTASVTAAAMKSAAVKSTFSVSAWLQTKTAIAGLAAALAVAGVTTITVKAVSTPADDVVSQLRKQSGEIVISEKRLDLPVTIVVKGMTLPEALDRLSMRAGAYWTVDYAIYDSRSALERLEGALRVAGTLDTAGWTNLSHAPHTISPMMVPHGAGVRFNMGMRLMPNSRSDDVKMLVDLGPEASQAWIRRLHTRLGPGSAGSSFNFNGSGDGGGGSGGGGGVSPPLTGGGGTENSDEYKILAQSMKDGEAEGILVPECLLAEDSLLPKINAPTPVEANAENTARIARQAGAHWVTIYTLRKSPLAGSGIRLVHAGMEQAYGASKPTPRFELSPDDREAHEAAVTAYLRKKASNNAPNSP